MFLKRRFFKITVGFSAIFFSVPTTAIGADSVLINEVAWMGSSANAADEWAELYNPTSLEIDLAGWGLYEAGGEVLIITLSGKIQPGGYYLIERTDDNSVSDIAADIFGSFSGSGLNNSGEDLVLKNSSGGVMDAVNASSGWPAGDNSLKASMERKSDGTWQTNDGIAVKGKDANGGPVKGTPKSANSGTSAAPAGASSGSTPPTQSGSGGSVPATPSALTAEAGSDIAIEVGYPIALSGLGSQGASLYKWYLGDGAVKEGAEITYTYRFPGTYLATLEVSNGGGAAFDQIKIFVFGGKALISEIFVGSLGNPSQWIEIFNPNSYPLDVSGWILESGSRNFILPSFVVIPKSGFIVFPKEITSLDFLASTAVKLKYPTGLTVDEAVFDKFNPGFSASRSGGEIFWTKEPTPGRPNIVLAGGASVSESLKTMVNRVQTKPDVPAQNYVASFYSQIKETPDSSNDALADEPFVSVQVGFWQKLWGELLFWAALAVVMGVVASLFYLKFLNKQAK